MQATQQPSATQRAQLVATRVRYDEWREAQQAAQVSRGRLSFQRQPANSEDASVDARGKSEQQTEQTPADHGAVGTECTFFTYTFFKKKFSTNIHTCISRIRINF